MRAPPASRRCCPRSRAWGALVARGAPCKPARAASASSSVAETRSRRIVKASSVSSPAGETAWRWRSIATDSPSSRTATGVEDSTQPSSSSTSGRGGSGVLRRHALERVGQRHRQQPARAPGGAPTLASIAVAPAGAAEQLGDLHRAGSPAGWRDPRSNERASAAVRPDRRGPARARGRRRRATSSGPRRWPPPRARGRPGPAPRARCRRPRRAPGRRARAASSRQTRQVGAVGGALHVVPRDRPRHSRGGPHAPSSAGGASEGRSTRSRSQTGSRRAQTTLQSARTAAIPGGESRRGPSPGSRARPRRGPPRRPRRRRSRPSARAHVGPHGAARCPSTIGPSRPRDRSCARAGPAGRARRRRPAAACRSRPRRPGRPPCRRRPRRRRAAIRRCAAGTSCSRGSRAALSVATPQTRRRPGSVASLASSSPSSTSDP